MSSPLDIGGKHGCRLRYPEPVIGRDMEQTVAALHRAIDRAAIGEVAMRYVDLEAGQIAMITVRPDEDPNCFTLGKQMPHHGRSDKTGSSRHQSRHSRFLNSESPAQSWSDICRQYNRNFARFHGVNTQLPATRRGSSGSGNRRSAGREHPIRQRDLDFDRPMLFLAGSITPCISE